MTNEEAIKIIDKGLDIGNQMPFLTRCQMNEAKQRAIKALSQQRTGRWEEIKSLWGGKWEMIDNYKCSVCGELEVSGNDYKYCPNCGAKMESEEQA